MKRKIKIMALLAAIVMLVLTTSSVALGAANPPRLRCDTPEVTVTNGGSTTVTVYYENIEASQLAGTIENTNIADAEFTSKADGVAKIRITGCGAGVCTVSAYSKDNPEKAVEITVTVKPSSEEIAQLNAVEYLSDRDFFYYDNEDCYVLNFSFKDKNEKRIKAPATVDVKIVNDNNETVYEKTHYVTMADFGTWTNSLYGERLLAAIYIWPDEIEKGSTDDGEVYFTIESSYWSFDESTVTASELPKIDATEQCTLKLPTVPKLLTYSSSSGSTVYSKVNITNITYEFEERYDGSVDLHIYYTGQKTYDYQGDNHSSSCKIGWKLYDAEGYVVESGTTYTSTLETDEKFKNCEETIYSLEPGAYTLKILNVN